MNKKKRLLRKKTDESRAVPMSPEVQRAMERQFQRFREKFGRDPGPDDPVFFDPDADTPQELNWDRVDSDIVGAMVKAGIEPEKVYAYRKTGLIVTEERYNQKLWMSSRGGRRILTIEESIQSFPGKEQGGYAMSQCDAAESSSQVEPQVIDGT